MTARPSVAVATIVAKNYLPFARVMVESLHRYHPDLPVTVLLSDRIEDCFDPGKERFRLMTPDALSLKHPERLCFRYGRKELAVALKPVLIHHLLERDRTPVVFLDPDLWVLGPLDDLLGLVESSPLLLTPHLAVPAQGAGAGERERRILQSGIFNGGVLGVSDCPQSQQFLDWWRSRLEEHCRYAPEEGICYDQRWLDFAPSFVPGLTILRDGRYNVAYWNLPERMGGSTRLFHASGFDPRHPELFSRHWRKFTPAEVNWMEPLLWRYGQAVLAAGFREAIEWPYAYSRFDNGVRIPELARRLYGEAGPEQFGDPFRCGDEPSFFNWLNSPVDRLRPEVTRFWQKVHAERADLQREFPDPRGADRTRFAGWISQFGVRELDVDPAFLIE
jgi:hypothetical protein